MVLNIKIHQELQKIADVAACLWEKNWAECNGGNISVNITSFVDESGFKQSSGSKQFLLVNAMPEIAGEFFYVTGSGCRMRDVAKKPIDYGCIIRISDHGDFFEILEGVENKPTSELPSHMAIQSYLKTKGVERGVVLHTHPTELIVLTHHKDFLDSEHLTRTLWSMIPETRVIAPKGVGVVPYVLPGSMKIAEESLKQLLTFDAVLWEKHGILVVGDDIVKCFDVVDALSKSAQIFLMARNAGFQPQGMSDEQLDELAIAFGLPQLEIKESKR